MRLASHRIQIVDGQPRIHSGREARRRAAGPQQSRRLTERLGLCLRRSSVFRRECVRDTAVLFGAAVAGLWFVAWIGYRIAQHTN